MYNDRTFCQFFFNKETKKLMAKLMLEDNSSNCMPTLPTATAKHKTYRRRQISIRMNILEMELIKYEEEKDMPSSFGT